MPIFEVETPDGVFEVDAPDEQTALGALAPQGSSTVNNMLSGMDNPVYGPGQVAPAPQQAAPQYGGGLGENALTEGSHAGAFFGFDDELSAGFNAPFHATADWYKGEGFDIGKAYNRLQQQGDARKAARREVAPVQSLVGEVAGGLGSGGTLARGGATLAGRNVPLVGSTGGAAIEGAAYGGLYGAGEAKPGERLQGAATGAAIGGLTGGALQGAGNILATRSARNAASAAAPTSDDLASASSALYRASEKEGVRFAQPAVQHLGANLKLAAGRINDKLRPKTAGFVDDIDDMVKGDMSLEVFDEFRKSLNRELRRATPDDERTLTAMKRMADNFADNVKPGQFTGDAKKATTFLKQARETWSRSKKTETVEKILDIADVDGAGKYTQSGFANAVRQEMKKLYKSIANGKEKGWTKEEVALIRQMAKGGSNSRIINLAAKFAPRGPMSIVLGQLLGSGMPGVGNVAIPLAGHAAGQMADRGALAAASALRTGAATGAAPRIAGQISQRTVPFIGASAAASTEIPRLLEGSLQPR